MNDLKHSTFVITREDRGFDAKKFVGEALTIGSEQGCHVWLNHPTVSPLHAGINQVNNTFYLTNLSPSNPTLLNGQTIPFKAFEPLIEGDEAQIGQFFLTCVEIKPGESMILITVRLQLALTLGVRRPTHEAEVYERQRTQKKITAPLEPLPSSLQIFWEKRTGGKAGRPSPLHPRNVTPGGARYKWRPTRDLIRPWPFAIFLWAALAIAALSGFAAFARKIAFAPGALSNPHTRTILSLTPAIAKEINGDSCTSCHAIGVSATNRAKMNANCEACHQAEGFAASIIPAHRDAGITCTSCHAEHRGTNFRPIKQALEACTKCHHDTNTQLYNGRSVHTPHGGTHGYPVVDGVWIWKGLEAEELEQKPDVGAFLKSNRVDETQPQELRNAQFHGLHVGRVRVVPGMDGIDSETGSFKVLSCSSCHKSGYMGSNVDRKYPRTTCARCHSTQVSNEAALRPGVDAPSCTSCHVQHVKDAHWIPPLLIAQKQLAKQPR